MHRIVNTLPSAVLAARQDFIQFVDPSHEVCYTGVNREIFYGAIKAIKLAPLMHP